jgi:hypothetical protein
MSLLALPAPKPAPTRICATCEQPCLLSQFSSSQLKHAKSKAKCQWCAERLARPPFKPNKHHVLSPDDIQVATYLLCDLPLEDKGPCSYVPHQTRKSIVTALEIMSLMQEDMETYASRLRAGDKQNKIKSLLVSMVMLLESINELSFHTELGAYYQGSSEEDEEDEEDMPDDDDAEEEEAEEKENEEAEEEDDDAKQDYEEESKYISHPGYCNTRPLRSLFGDRFLRVLSKVFGTCLDVYRLAHPSLFASLVEFRPLLRAAHQCDDTHSDKSGILPLTTAGSVESGAINAIVYVLVHHEDGDMYACISAHIARKATHFFSVGDMGVVVRDMSLVRDQGIVLRSKTNSVGHQTVDLVTGDTGSTRTAFRRAPRHFVALKSNVKILEDISKAHGMDEAERQRILDAANTSRAIDARQMFDRLFSTFADDADEEDMLFAPLPLFDTLEEEVCEVLLLESLQTSDDPKARLLLEHLATEAHAPSVAHLVADARAHMVDMQQQQALLHAEAVSRAHARKALVSANTTSATAAPSSSSTSTTTVMSSSSSSDPLAEMLSDGRKRFSRILKVAEKFLLSLHPTRVNVAGSHVVYHFGSAGTAPLTLVRVHGKDDGGASRGYCTHLYRALHTTALAHLQNV